MATSSFFTNPTITKDSVDSLIECLNRKDVKTNTGKVRTVNKLPKEKIKDFFNYKLNGKCK